MICVSSFISCNSAIFMTLQALYSSGPCHLISQLCAFACAGLAIQYVQFFFFFNIHLEPFCKERRGLMKYLFVTEMNLTCTSVLQLLFCSRITCYMSPSFRLCAFFLKQNLLLFTVVSPVHIKVPGTQKPFNKYLVSEIN